MISLIEKLKTDNLKHDLDKAKEINARIDFINIAIQSYNQEMDLTSTNKRELLLQIERAFRNMDALSFRLFSWPRSLKQDYTQSIRRQLRSDIQKEFVAMGKLATSSISAWEQICFANPPLIKASDYLKDLKKQTWSDASARGAASEILTQLMMYEQERLSPADRYEQLIRIKDSLRDLLIRIPREAPPVRQIIIEIIGRVNGDIAHIAKHDPKEILYEQPIVNALRDDAYDNIHELFNELTKFESNEKFHQEWDEKFSVIRPYNISALSLGNSFVFKLENPLTATNFIMKLCMNPEENTQKLVSNPILSTYIAPTILSRTCSDEGHKIELTKLYSGDVLGYAKKIAQEKKIATACRVHDQMRDILLTFQKNKGIFLDMKPTNFLVSEDGRLVISDTKSFEAVEPDGKWVEGVAPPMADCRFTAHEYRSGMNVDKFHAHGLGLSLFLYLSDQEIGSVDRTKHQEFYNFDKYPIFKTPIGQQYKELITALVEINPERRIGLQEAKRQLASIRSIIAKSPEFLSRDSAAALGEEHPVSAAAVERKDDNFPSFETGVGNSQTQLEEMVPQFKKSLSSNKPTSDDNSASPDSLKP